jgi:hypothetical protein
MLREEASGNMIQIGKRTPRYLFGFGPDDRSDRPNCACCERRTLQGWVVLVAHIAAGCTVPVATPCRYCRACDVLTVRPRDLDAALAERFLPQRPEILGQSYIVLGSLDESGSHLLGSEALTPDDLADFLHDFRGAPAPRTRRAAHPGTTVGAAATALPSPGG